MTPKTRRRKPQQKVTGGLRAFAEAKKTSNPLLQDIQTHVVAQGNLNAGVGREDHKVHVSELIKDTACPRHLYFKITKVEKTDPPEAAFHRLEWIWATGHDAHHKYQRWITEMGDMWGSWSCKVCKHSWVDLAPAACPECDSALLQYDEVNLEDEHYKIVGHADGAVPRLNCLVEVKSFSLGTVRIENPELVKKHTHKTEDGKTLVDEAGVWDAIKRPLRGHLVQGMFYLWMCKRQGLPFDKIVFIYENKATQATKAFEVSFAERFVTEHLQTMDAVIQAVEDKVAPKRPALFTRDSKPCNNCVFRTTCYEEISDHDGEESPSVPAGRSGARSQEAGRAAAVQSAAEAEGSDSPGPRRHHRPQRPRPDRDDDAVNPVGRASRRPVGDGRGGRAVGGRRTGQGEGSRFSRQGARRNRA